MFSNGASSNGASTSPGQPDGGGDDASARARAALAATDARIAEADRTLAEVVDGARRVAAESIRRLEAVRAQIDAAVLRRRTDTPAAAREFAAFLLDKTREIHDIVAAARAEASADAVVLRALSEQYRQG